MPDKRSLLAGQGLCRLSRAAGWQRRCLALLGLAMLLLLAACDRATLPPIAESRRLVVVAREGTTVLAHDESKRRSGFEYDLLDRFAQSIGKKLRLVVVNDDAKVIKRLQDGKAHLGAAWLTAGDAPTLPAGPAFFSSANLVIGNADALPAKTPADLAGKRLYVLAGSRQAVAARALYLAGDGSLQIIEQPGKNEFALFERVSSERNAVALVDRAVFDIASNFYPQLQPAFRFGGDIAISWLFASADDRQLLDAARRFFTAIKEDGSLERLIDQYFGHVNRLRQVDTMTFIERIRTLLPLYRADFEAAARANGLDWRLLAALAYQESHWDPLATSPTGVRGMMMLTGETADQLGVRNRLDPKESIPAGARYLADLREALPQTIPEPDRTWLAIAAYNLGMGHLKGARYIAGTLKKDADSWYEMKSVLPLLARPQYYQRLKAGRGRGGEAVIMTENIRVFYDILGRFVPLDPASEPATGGLLAGVADGE